MDIVAAVTVGDTQNIAIGKNGIFYDRQGHDWDARVTSVIDNPISIGQAAWSPYRKMAAFIEEKVRSMAASKESKLTESATAQIDAKAESAAAATAEAVQMPGLRKILSRGVGCRLWFVVFSSVAAHFVTSDVRRSSSTKLNIARSGRHSSGTSSPASRNHVRSVASSSLVVSPDI